MTDKKKVFLNMLVEALAPYGFVRYKDGAGRLKGTVYQYICLEHVFHGGPTEIEISMTPLAVIKSAASPYCNKLSFFVPDCLGQNIDTCFDEEILKNMQRSIRILKETILPVYDGVDSAASLLDADEQLANYGVECNIKRIKHERASGFGSKTSIETEIEEARTKHRAFLQRHRCFYCRFCFLEMGKYDEAYVLWSERAKEFEEKAHEYVDSVISKDYNRLSFENKKAGVPSSIDNFMLCWNNYFELRKVIWQLENHNYDWIQNVYLSEKSAEAISILKKAKIIS